MDAPAQPPSPVAEPDEFDVYWDRAIFGGSYDVIIVDPDEAPPMFAEAGAPIGYHNLMQIMKHEQIMRAPVRKLFGRNAHVYMMGYFPSDMEQRAIVDALPYNLAMSELLSRHGFEAEVNGRVVIVVGDAIDCRDTQETMIDADAETMPEIERDHIHSIGPAADAEWKRIETAVGLDLINTKVNSVPSTHHIAWLIRVLMVGLDKDIIGHAALQEVAHKNPILMQAMSALWNVQAAHFTGRFDDAEEDYSASIYDAPKTPAPAGFSQRHQAVIH
jgi:hypothetical protein